MPRAGEGTVAVITVGGKRGSVVTGQIGPSRPAVATRDEFMTAWASLQECPLKE
jgi:hypothetical protein